MNNKVLLVSNCNPDHLSSLLEKYTLSLHKTDPEEAIPGSFWGDSEAGLIGHKVYVRDDTPIHSLLHETCHFICMDSQRREQLDTDAAGDYDEENAVCYLQILLADLIPEMGQARMFADMDSWGYTFRLGSAQNWFMQDAKDALDWLKRYKLVDHVAKPTYLLRR